MDKMSIAIGTGVLAGFYIASRIINVPKANRPTLETINDYHLYQSQQEQMKTGNLFADNNNSNLLSNSNQTVAGVNPNSYVAQNLNYPSGNVNEFYNRYAYNVDFKNPSQEKSGSSSPYAHLINSEPNKK